MILQALDQLYDRIVADSEYAVPLFGRSRQKIAFKIVLKPNGDLVDIQDVRPTGSGRVRSLQLLVLGGTKPPGQGLNPCFLWDNASYLLGVPKAPDDSRQSARARAQFEASRERHLSVESQIASPAYRAVCRFLEQWSPEKIDQFELFNETAPTGFGVFQIVGETRYVQDDPAVEQWWSTRHNRVQWWGDSVAEVELGQCLVTGERAPIARLHEKIRGVVGAQGAGAPLSGFNNPAFESYGWEQTFNAPVSESVAFRYVNALNALLDGPRSSRHRFRLGDATVAFWTDRPNPLEDIFLEFLKEGSSSVASGQDDGLRQRLQAFLGALREGSGTSFDEEGGDGSTGYHVLALSPNAGRVSVRFFHSGSVGELLSNLRQHHSDIGLPITRDSDLEFLPSWMLLRQSARESKEIPPLLAGPLLRSILEGQFYPDALYRGVLRRISIDATIDRVRACILKGFLTRNRKLEISMSLDPDREDVPYRLGRLFAALEKTQSDALGGNLNRTIRDSFYASASATPRMVFPRLLRVHQHHLAKLDPGPRVGRDKLVQQIIGGIREFPAHLGLDDQGLFAIGYYHQRQDFFAPRGNRGGEDTQEERA